MKLEKEEGKVSGKRKFPLLMAAEDGMTERAGLQNSEKWRGNLSEGELEE